MSVTQAPLAPPTRSICLLSLWVSREREIDAVKRLLSATHLVTLAGPIPAGRGILPVASAPADDAPF